MLYKVFVAAYALNVHSRTNESWMVAISCFFSVTLVFNPDLSNYYQVNPFEQTCVYFLTFELDWIYRVYFQLIYLKQLLYGVA